MLKAVNLTKRYGNHLALDALNLSVAPGEILCLLGANGAGKTTTIHLFLGFLEPSCGQALVDGKSVVANLKEARAATAYVPEQVQLYPMLTGLENLTYFTRLAGREVPRPESLLSVLEHVGLGRSAANSKLAQYSKGMRQKVGLAIALAKGAKALLLDEPLSGLDPKAANDFCGMLRQLSQTGVAVLMTTHDLFRAKDVGHRFCIMKSGRLVEDVDCAALDYRQLEVLYLDHMRRAGVPS